jgi:PAS domain S-box-containing protein
MTSAQEPAHLRTLIDQLHTTIGRLTLALSLARDAFAWTDARGHIIWCNAAFDRLAGADHVVLLGESLVECLRLERGGQLVRGDAHPARRIFTEGPELVERFEATCSKGRIAVEVYGRRGMIEGEPAAVFVIQDITKAVQADADLRQLNRRLVSANDELEAFTYSVSHDLRTPLRRIDGFSQALLEDYAGVLDAQGKDYLFRLRNGAQRMTQLIDDMLRLSRVTRAELTWSEVDLSAMCRAVIAELAASTPERRVDVEIADGLSAWGDARLIELAIENLMSNAWKFTGKTPRARIEVGMASDGAEPVFFVRDNGAGFDVTRADQLFGAFQRLHGVDEFSGTGIGLAIVRRIVHRHGGRVWADGQVGRGATFYFTLPRERDGACEELWPSRLPS